MKKDFLSNILLLSEFFYSKSNFFKKCNISVFSHLKVQKTDLLIKILHTIWSVLKKVLYIRIVNKTFLFVSCVFLVEIDSSFAQFNLVPNPSFEIFDTCSNNGRIHKSSNPSEKNSSKEILRYLQILYKVSI
jgi:hypothetical protein